MIKGKRTKGKKSLKITKG